MTQASFGVVLPLFGNVLLELLNNNTHVTTASRGLKCKKYLNHWYLPCTRRLSAPKDEDERPERIASSSAVTAQKSVNANPLQMPWTQGMKLDPLSSAVPSAKGEKETCCSLAPQPSPKRYMYSKNKKKPLEDEGCFIGPRQPKKERRIRD